MAAASLSALPTDVLACIFSFAPLRARLRTLSFVCRRWRTAVLRSVAEFTYIRGDLNSILSLLPALAGLALVNACPTPIALPRQLRRLTLRLPPAEEADGREVIDLRAPIPPLTDLSIFCTSPAHLALALSVLQATRDSLTSLVLCAVTNEGQLESYLAATHLPALREFSFVVSSAELQTSRVLNLIAFIAAHASQLTSLTLSGEQTLRQVDVFERISQIAFPQLRTLVLHVEELSDVCMTNLLTHSTQLTHLRVALTDAYARVNPRLLSSLAVLRITHYSSPADFEIVPSLPNLRDVWVHCTIPLPTSAAVRRRLSCWSFDAGFNRHQVWRVLPEMTNLSQLTLTHTSPPATLHLPKLTKLKLGRVKLPFAAVYELLSLFLRVAPLRSLNVARLNVTGASDFEISALVELLREGVRRSLVKVKLRCDDTSRLEGALAFGNAHGWLRMLIRPIHEGQGTRSVVSA